jgi:hypothetical protein
VNYDYASFEIGPSEAPVSPTNSVLRTRAKGQSAQQKINQTPRDVVNSLKNNHHVVALKIRHCFARKGEICTAQAARDRDGEGQRALKSLQREERSRSSFEEDQVARRCRGGLWQATSRRHQQQQQQQQDLRKLQCRQLRQL